MRFSQKQIVTTYSPKIAQRKSAIRKLYNLKTAMLEDRKIIVGNKQYDMYQFMIGIEIELVFKVQLKMHYIIIHTGRNKEVWEGKVCKKLLILAFLTKMGISRGQIHFPSFFNHSGVSTKSRTCRKELVKDQVPIVLQLEKKCVARGAGVKRGYQLKVDQILLLHSGLTQKRLNVNKLPAKIN